MKKINLILSIMICLNINNLKVYASSGRLRNDSIKTCNGVTYGQHGSDNHWHIAEKKDNIYYSNGASIYKDPCNTSTNNSNYNSNSSNSKIDNNKSQNNSNNTNVTTSTSNTSKTITNTNSTNNDKTNKETTPTQKNIDVRNDNANVEQETIIVKNDDNTLKNIIIDNINVEIKDIINYSTTKDSIDIKVETNDVKASYEIKNNNILIEGKNEIIIEVKAESGKIKIYKIIVNKEIIKSSNVEIDLIINGEKIIFDNFKSKIYISSSTDKINVDYTLEDSKSKVIMNEIDKLKKGNNLLNIKVIAEDGTTQEYQVDIYKYSSTEEFIYGVLGFAMLGGVGYGIYRLIKKIKSK